jgi:hypothetical protein
MTWAAPGLVRMPAAEGVREPGFDGTVEAAQARDPYVPAGASIWELSTENPRGGKPTDDYKKRTRESSEELRRNTTYVAVSSRRWPSAARWAKTRRDSSDGWADVRAFNAEDLATWLERCPSVNGWLASEMGRAPWGVEALRDWLANWTESTTPAVPPALLLCGRSSASDDLRRTLLDVPASAYPVSTSTREEATAFVAATLASDPPSAVLNSVTVLPNPSAGAESSAAGLMASVDAAREGLLERALVVHTPEAWRELVTHEDPLVLISMLSDTPDTAAAVRARHHVVSPRATDPLDQNALPRLDRACARAAWARAGVPYPDFDRYARDARRSLSAWRRRHTEGGDPAQWARGPRATLLAPALLAAAWEDDQPRYPGDRAVLEALCGREWRALARELEEQAAQPDSPVQLRHQHWAFSDPLDAWGQLRASVTGSDLEVFHEKVLEVLGERDPLLDLDPENRWHAPITSPTTSRRHSETLRGGLATTLAILGAELHAVPLAGDRTGQQHADQAVRDLLRGAGADRWQSIAELLPTLAEAAPRVFLDQIETSLTAADRPVLAVVTAVSGPWGASDQGRWLLEAFRVLVWEPNYLTRVAVIVARMLDDENGPGPRLREELQSLMVSALHLAAPQSAVLGSSPLRLAVLDAVRRHHRSLGWDLMASLVRGLYQLGMIAAGPRWREWRQEFNELTELTSESIDQQAEQPMSELAARLLADSDHDPERWRRLLELYLSLGPAQREELLRAAEQGWADLPAHEHHRVLRPLREILERDARHLRQLPEVEQAVLQRFVDDHDDARATRLDLFTDAWPTLPGLPFNHPDWDDELHRRRAEAAAALLEAGLPALVETLGEFPDGPAPYLLGRALGDLAETPERDMLTLLGEPESAGRRLAGGYAARRAELERTWLDAAIEARPDLVLNLLSAAPVTADVLAVVNAQDEPTRAAYWQTMAPGAVPAEVAPVVAEQLAAAARPAAAIWVVHRMLHDGEPTAELVVGVLTSEHQITMDDGMFAIHLDVTVPALIDYLEGIGVDEEVIAALQLRYLEVFDPTHRPATHLHRFLARSPEGFARLAALAYETSPDPDPDGPGPEQGAGPAGDAPSPLAGQRARQVIQQWREPLPGSTAGELPTSDETLAWVRQVGRDVAASVSGEAAAEALAEALSAPTTDPDGRWPSTPVRDALEELADARIEADIAWDRSLDHINHLVAPPAGAQDGRGLAAHYQDEADRWHTAHPRAAMLLERIVAMLRGEEDRRRRDDDLRDDQ